MCDLLDPANDVFVLQSLSYAVFVFWQLVSNLI